MPTTRATRRVIMQDIVQHHALVQVVTAIISKSHQQPVINPITTQNQWKQLTKHVH